MASPASKRVTTSFGRRLELPPVGGDEGTHGSEVHAPDPRRTLPRAACNQSHNGALLLA